ncbi:glycosyltransferase [Ponticoccus sp. (in: a-proteobacteria)]|uniref:glycosyltransferase n=1 Tax=Ponticoccus sp. (in: a-proteobacteria) TaxID=1925025 RepID=UPI003AB44DC3
MSPNPAPRLVAVVVTHNRLDHLKTTVGRLLDSPAADLDGLVVVDNASDDGTAAWLAAQSDPRLDVLRLAVNGGGAGGFEAGMRHAMARDIPPDWVLVMDDDARPEPGALAAFHAMDRGGWDALAAAVYHPNGRICDINRPSVNPFWHGRAFLDTVLGVFTGKARDGFHLTAEAYESAEIREVDIGSFVGLFVSRGAIERTGYPDAAVFIYGDDVLYSLRMRERGLRIAFVPGLRFEHDFKSLQGPVQRFRPLWKAYYNHRNLLLVYRRAAGVFFWPALLLILPKWWRKARHYGGDRAVFKRVMRAAIRDGLRRDLSRSHAEVVALATVVEDVAVEAPKQ